jgi:hypothetical protein
MEVTMIGIVTLIGWMGCSSEGKVTLEVESSVDSGTTVDSGETTESVDTGLEPTYRSKSLVIIWDGTRPDALADANTPHMDSLIEGTWHSDYRGAYSPLAQNLYDATTVSGPNHATIMTGANGSQHGVTGNGDVGLGDFESFPHYLQRLENEDSTLNTACLFTWGTDGLISSGADFIYDGEDADNVERVVAMLDGTFEGDGWSLGTSPDAIFLFLDDSDHAGHAHGFEMSVPEYHQELTALDGQLGTILEALTNRETFAEESWQIVFTSDHGGYETSHSGNGASEHTIPFLAVGRTVEQGRLPLDTSIVDVVPTILTHHGVAIPSELTGISRGTETINGASLLDAELLRYYAFDGTLTDGSSANVSASIGSESDHDPVLQESGGKFNGHLSILDLGGGTNDSSYVTIGQGSDINFAADQPFSITLWYRSKGEQSGDPLIFGNKDWSSGGNPGWLLSANEGGQNSFGTNYASTSSDRVDIEDIDYADTEWWFLAAVVHPGNIAVLYAGNAIGMRWIAHQFPSDLSLLSDLPLNIGQDGTGMYSHNLNGDVDDLAIWKGALTFEDIQHLYADGEGISVGTMQ